MEKEIYLLQGTTRQNWCETFVQNIETKDIDTFCKVWTIAAYRDLSEAEEEAKTMNSTGEDENVYFIQNIKLY